MQNKKIADGARLRLLVPFSTKNLKVKLDLRPPRV